MSAQYSSDACTDDTVHCSYKPAKKPTRRLKGVVIQPKVKLKLTKPNVSDIISESPYGKIQSISKNRSISGSKSKLNKSPSSSISGNQSLFPKHKSQPLAYPQLHQSEMISSLRNKFLNVITPIKTSSKIIEEKLINTLKKLKDKNLSFSQFEAYQIAFAEVIEKDELYGGLLKKIKEAYEQKIKYEKIDLNKDIIEKFKEEIALLREKNLKIKGDKKILTVKIEKLAKENAQLSRDLEDREFKYIDLQDKLMKLSKVDLNEVSLDETNWKFLINENGQLLRDCEDMKKELRNLTRKERKLVKLVLALRNRGFPVEEVYQNDVHKEKKDKWVCNEPVKDDSENENLVSGRIKLKEKPKNVPNLDLKDLEGSGDESSESSFSSESEIEQ